MYKIDNGYKLYMLGDLNECVGKRGKGTEVFEVRDKNENERILGYRKCG